MSILRYSIDGRAKKFALTVGLYRKIRRAETLSLLIPIVALDMAGKNVACHFAAVILNELKDPLLSLWLTACSQIRSIVENLSACYSRLRGDDNLFV